MTIQHLARMRRDPVYKTGVAVIEKLRRAGVPLRYFVTSDWHSAPAYVYIDIRGKARRRFHKNGTRRLGIGRGAYVRSWGPDLCHQFARFDDYGIRQALTWYKKNA